MSGKAKLITLGVVAGCLAAGFVAVEWNLLVGAEGRLWEASKTPDTAKIYLMWADHLEYEDATGNRLMHLSPSMMAHLDQRRREAAAFEAKQPKAAVLSSADKRKKIREDYEKSAKSLNTPPDMAAAMLSLIDDANSRNDGIPYRVTSKIEVQGNGDQDMELLAQNHGVPPPFDPGTGCGFDTRRNAEPIQLTNLGVDKTGIFVTVTLKELPQPLVMTQTINGNSETRRERQLGGIVEVNVVPPQGAPVRAITEYRAEGFGIDTKVRKDKQISNYDIYLRQIEILSTNACFEIASLLGTRD